MIAFRRLAPLPLLLAGLAALAALLVATEVQAQSVEPDPPLEIPVDWALRPSGLEAGDRFRLLFLSSTGRNAESTDIAVYNSFVQARAAAGHADIQAYSSQFRAVACTSAVDARDNTGTTGTGVPIYWLGGAKAADDDADFYDESWDEEVTVRDESGGAVTIASGVSSHDVWTGCDHDGTELFTGSNTSAALGAALGGIGHLNWPLDDYGPLSKGDSRNAKAQTELLYGLSPVFVVMPLEIPVDWALRPSGLEAGDRFRLLFLSSTGRNAESTDIAVYNSFVQARAAAGHADIQAYSSQFRAVACTSAVDARDNTGTTGTGVPIYWLGGAKAADDDADFYDESWDEEVTVRDESGGAVTIASGVSSHDVWTGCDHDGTELFTGSNTSAALGAALGGIGHLNWPLDDYGPLSKGDSRNAKAQTELLYGLSPVFVVMPLEIPVDWALRPSGLEAGDRFRLLFLSSTGRNAESTDIAVYNSFVQARAAAGHADIQAYSSQFRAVACTSAVDARDNTGTTGTGVPIYWLGGAKAADDDADFYDESWDEEVTVRDESGGAVTIASGVSSHDVWTGCDHDGTELFTGSNTSAALGAALGGIGHLNWPLDDYGPLSKGDSRNAKAQTELLYGLSPVFVVGDDPAVAVSFEQASYSVAEGGMVTVKVQLSADPKREVVVPLTTTNQGGASSSDYSGVPATVTFQSGDTEKSFTFTAAADTDDDDDESVKLGFGTLPTGVTAGTTSESTISIRDNDDPAVTVRFELANYSVAEGDTVAVKVQLSAAPERTVAIPLTTTNQSGATGADYSGVPAGVTFQSGDTEKSFTFTAAQDAVDDDGESVKLGFGALPARVTAGARNEATVSIADNDDPAITVRFERASYTVAEGGSFTVKVQLNMNPERTVTIPLTTTNRGGASSSDYSGVPASVTFQSGETEQSFTFTATQDTVDDDDESVRLGFSTLPAKVTAGTTRRATVSITDDDDPAVTVRFELADYSVAEGDTVDVEVRLNVAPERTVIIPLTSTNEAGASSSDYSGVPSSVTFQSGDTERSFTFTAALDSVQDDAERVKLGFGPLPARVTAGARDEATVLITDDDAPAITVGFEMADYPVAEGDNVAVRVKLNKNPERTVTIPLTTINQNGASSGDYSGVPSSVTFQSGQTVRSFTFTAARDAVEDDGESVKLGFGTLPAKVTSGATDEATVSITDVAPVVNQPPTVSATVDPATVYPGEFVTLIGVGTDPDGDALIFSWTSDGGGIFAPAAFSPQTAWIAPATETAHTVNLTMTATDTGGLSASVTVSVLLEPFPQPNAATDLEANVQEDNTIHLRWTIPSQPSGVTITSVEAQRRMSGGAFSPPSWDTVVTLPASATFTGVPGLAADTEYVFRVRLTTTHGLFADSRYIRVRTLTGAPAPRHFAASGPTQTSITLNWFTVETAAAYKLEYRKDGETEWNRISGDFDHLPSTTDHRDALGVAAGLDCNTRYDFRLSARGSGETRNDGNRYPSTHFGSYATTSAQTGECAQEERVTNLLVSVEPSCAILTWTPPSGDRDTGYRVERYSHTGRAVGELQRTPLETLVEEPNRVANRYEDCSAEYRTDGAEHFYSVTALDNNPGPDEEGAFGTAYTSMLRYGTSREPEGPLNVRLTHDTQSSRWLAWDAPRDPWLTTVKTARAGSGPQQVVTDPWTTGYRVERREYRRTEGGGWFLPEVEDEPIWSATMTVGSSTTGTGSTGYFGLGSNAFGAMTQPTFTHPVGSGSWEVTGLFVLAGELRLSIQEGAPFTDNLHTDAFEDWVLVVDGRSFPFELPEGVVGGNLQVSWPNHGLNWIDGQQVSLALVERLDWESLRDETDGDTGTSFTDSEDKGDKQYVYRVWAYNPRGLSLYSWRGDWVFNGGDPGGDPEPAVYVPPPPAQQQGGETPSNTPATGAPAISGTPQVGETLTATTAGIADEDGLTKVSYTYQWTAGGSDIDGATGSSYTLTSSEQGQTVQVRVTFTDDADNAESLTSVATVAVAAAPNREATGQPAISGTPQVGQTLTAGTAGIADEDGLTKVSYTYQWTAGGSDIDGATGSSYTLTSSEQGQTVQVRVTFTDDADNAESLTSEATETVVQAPSPLTVSLENAATTHNGTDVFTFEIRFSEQFGLSYKTLRDDAFTVVGGEVKKAQRMDRDSDTPNIWWRITVEPDGNGDVTITLPATTDCTDDGAICTEDGRKLSNRLEFTVSGPGG